MHVPPFEIDCVCSLIKTCIIIILCTLFPTPFNITIDMQVVYTCTSAMYAMHYFTNCDLHCKVAL